MAGYGIGRMLRLAVVALATAMFSLPITAFAAVGRFIVEAPSGGIVRFIADLFRSPALALEGFGGFALDPSLLQRQRHEAGIARLGAVRHV